MVSFTGSAQIVHHSSAKRRLLTEAHSTWTNLVHVGLWVQENGQGSDAMTSTVVLAVHNYEHMNVALWLKLNFI